MTRVKTPEVSTGDWHDKMAAAVDAITDGIQQPDAVPVQPDTVPDATVATKPTPFDWSTLDEPTVLPRKNSWADSAVDVMTATPENIRESIENILGANVRRIAATTASNAKRPRVDYMWVLQRIPSAEVAEEFRALVTAYCLHRPGTGEIPFAEANTPSGRITPRFGDPKWYKQGPKGGMVECAETDTGAVYGVRYSIRPFEARSPATDD